MLLLSCVISKATVRFFIQYLLCSNNSTTGMSSYPTLFLASRNRGEGSGFLSPESGLATRGYIVLHSSNRYLRVSMRELTVSVVFCTGRSPRSQEQIKIVFSLTLECGTQIPPQFLLPRFQLPEYDHEVRSVPHVHKGLKVIFKFRA